jgi:hypothetical protein
MPTGFIHPRSGYWKISSKSDPRWDREEQYSSLTGEPPLLMPAEARRALDEIRRSFLIQAITFCSPALSSTWRPGPKSDAKDVWPLIRGPVGENEL